jgi:hypothetical protein
MAPRTEHRASSRSTRNRRDRRYAHTGAGVNASRPSAVGGRGGPRPRNPAPPGGRLVDRMTVDDDQRRRTRPQDHRHRPRPQQGGRPRLQDRITYGNDGGGVASPRQGQGLAARMTRDANVNGNGARTNSHAHGPASFTNTGPAFHASELSQVLPDSQRRLFPVTAPGRFAIFARAQAANPIRMTNVPVSQIPNSNAEPTSPKRPINTYRGPDMIKRMFTNPTLRAVLAGKRVPTARRKSREEKPMLRMGMVRATK